VSNTQAIPANLPPVTPGTVLAGKYRVEKIIGQGGMGIVVEAKHIALDERVALKFLLPDYAMHPEAAARFLREARAAVRIKSEHVARVLDVGEIAGGSPYIVMEFLEGEDLEDYIARRGRAPIDEAIGYILQASEAIAEAHALGIVHRDLKPGNLFLTARADGSTCIKVLDFGISKVDPRLARNQAALTSATAILGSPLYMAPEQMRSARDADSRSDLWSLGMILYELLTGHAAFDAPTVMEMCNRIQGEQPASIRKVRAEVPEELEAAVMRCLAKRAEDRFQTLGQLVDAIAPFGPARAQISVERVHAVMTRAGVVTGRPSSPHLGPASNRRGPSSDTPGLKPRSRSVEPSAVTVDADALASQAALRGTPAAWAQTSGKRARRGALVWIGAGALVSLLLAGGWALRGGSSERVVPSGEPFRPAAAAPSPVSAAAPEVVPSQVAAPAEEPADESGAPSASASAAPRRRVRGPLPVSSARTKATGAASAPVAPGNLFDEQK
jgi:eukaryotic-like serine/threonine-protein kinase